MAVKLAIFRNEWTMFEQFDEIECVYLYPTPDDQEWVVCADRGEECDPIPTKERALAFIADEYPGIEIVEGPHPNRLIGMAGKTLKMLDWVPPNWSNMPKLANSWITGPAPTAANLAMFKKSPYPNPHYRTGNYQMSPSSASDRQTCYAKYQTEPHHVARIEAAIAAGKVVTVDQLRDETRIMIWHGQVGASQNERISLEWSN